MNGLRNRTAGKAIAVAIGVLALIGGAGVGSASAVTTVSRTGSVGVLYMSGKAHCNMVNDYSDTSLGAPETHVGRAPSYASSTQTIWAINRVDYWSGSQWLPYRYGAWQKVVTSPNQMAGFWAEDVPISRIDLVHGWLTYRVATIYRWQVGQSTIGEVTNHYEARDYTPYSFNFFQPLVGDASAGYSSWCTFPRLAAG